MASNQPEGNIRGGDQPRMTEKQLGRDQPQKRRRYRCCVPA